MASKIITDNPKHHKYITVNKYERKKNKINVIFNHINKIYYTIYETIDDWWNRHFRTSSPGTHPIYHGIKGYKIIYDDCNHTTYRVYNKKTHKFINKLYKNRKGHLYIDAIHFKIKNTY